MQLPEACTTGMFQDKKQHKMLPYETILKESSNQERFLTDLKYNFAPIIDQH